MVSGCFSRFLFLFSRGGEGTWTNPCDIFGFLVFVGFRFGMYRGEHVDILYGNVKHSFFQARTVLPLHSKLVFQ